MPEDVRVNENRRIVKVTLSGAVSTADIANWMTKIRRISKETGIHKIFVDATEQEKMPDTLSLFHFFSTFPQNLRAALLFHKSHPTSNDILFAETVSLNRGIPVHAFESEEEALKWLNR